MKIFKSKEEKKMSKKNEEDITTGLTRKGTAEFGQALIEQAQEANRKSLQQSIVGKVQEYMANLQKQEVYLENCQANIELLKKKLEAIKQGEVEFTPYGKMTFNDSKLEKEIVQMAECVNCGAGLLRGRGL